jgi:hypothetical protein
MLVRDDDGDAHGRSRGGQQGGVGQGAQAGAGSVSAGGGVPTFVG